MTVNPQRKAEKGVPVIFGELHLLSASPCTQGEGWGGGSAVVPQNAATPAEKPLLEKC